MNALYGAPDRVRVLAADLVEHWEARSEQMRKFIGGPGKGIIVCATRQICADLYAQIIGLKPDWHDDDIAKGKIKVVYTGGPDDPKPIREARPAAVAEQADPAPDEGHRRRPGTGHRPVDVAHRVRLTAAAHPLPRPADARRRADAGAGPGQPHVPRQAGRPARRVRPADREPLRGAGRVHRHRSADQAPGPGHRRGHVQGPGPARHDRQRDPGRLRLARRQGGQGRQARIHQRGTRRGQLPARPGDPRQPGRGRRGHSRRALPGRGLEAGPLLRPVLHAQGHARPAGRDRVLRGDPGLDGQDGRRGAAGPGPARPRRTSRCTCVSSPPERSRPGGSPTCTRRPGSPAPICRIWTRRSSSGCSRPATRTWPSRRCGGSSSRRCARSPGTTSSGSRASPTGWWR